MNYQPKSLMQIFPRSFDVPIMLLTSAILLGFGLYLPVIKLNELVFWTHTFSVYTGIISLWKEQHYFLSVIILVFSIIFPFIKLGVLCLVWFRRISNDQRETYLKWLANLGKWSMLDVFVVAITIVVAKISKFASAEPKIGIYFFGGSIILAILVTMRIERLTNKI